MAFCWKRKLFEFVDCPANKCGELKIRKVFSSRQMKCYRILFFFFFCFLSICWAIMLMQLQEWSWSEFQLELMNTRIMRIRILRRWKIYWKQNYPASPLSIENENFAVFKQQKCNHFWLFKFSISTIVCLMAIELTNLKNKMVIWLEKVFHFWEARFHRVDIHNSPHYNSIRTWFENGQKWQLIFFCDFLLAFVRQSNVK